MTTTNHKMAHTSGPSTVSCQAGELRSVTADLNLDASHTGFLTGDIYHMVKVPAEHVIVDAILVADDVDDGVALSIEVGITDDGIGGSDATALMASVTTGQGGGVSRATGLGLIAPPSATERKVGITVTAGAGTPAVGTVRLVVLYRTQYNGE